MRRVFLALAFALLCAGAAWVTSEYLQRCVIGRANARLVVEK